ncbi:MAG: hypothetical protein DCC56_02410 [Anaerolineae bacterium]|nr:MAG: hypothetical protein DCC56_02410 [Anaerolineae bacterium]WKZ44890.1 MAG: hypothetical protein QY302_03740 [Anaerolineales bacterium]
MDKLEIVSPLFLLEREKITALTDKVIVEFTNPIREYRVEFKYSELKPRVVRGKSGDPGWTNLGNFLLALAAIIAFGSLLVFRSFLDSSYYQQILLGLAALSLVAHSLRLVKHDKVWFDEKDGSHGFLIKLTHDNREEAEKIISHITKKINQAKSKPAK